MDNKNNLSLIEQQKLSLAIEVDNSTSQKLATDLLQTVKSIKKELGNQEQAELLPVKVRLQQIKDKFAKPLADCDEVIRELNRKLVEYQLKLNAEVAKLNQQAVEVGNRPVFPEQKNIKTATTTAFFTEKILVEVFDDQLVPRQYCTPSEALLRQAYKAGVKDIQGVKFSVEKSLVNRAK
jgi:hypothetical protein